MHKLPFIFTFTASLVLLLGARAVLSQQVSGTCPAVVTQAMTQMQHLCDAAGRNQVCYGNFNVTAVPQPNVSNFQFNVGDVRDIDLIQSLQLSPLDTQLNQWGLALLRVQANLPNTLPGQNVTLLVFGDTTLIPALNADGVVGQAFRLNTRVGRVDCQQAPTDGVLIQTPQGTRRVALNINGVDFQIGSTAYIQATFGSRMRIKTLRGAVRIRNSYGETIIVAGTESNVPIDNNGDPTGAPEDPQSYDLASVQDLPLDGLDQPVTPADPLTDDQLNQLLDQLDSGDTQAVFDQYDPNTGDVWFDNGNVIDTPPEDLSTPDVTDQPDGGDLSLPLDTEVPLDLSLDTPTDVPPDLQLDLPTDIPPDIPTDIPPDVPTDVPLDIPTDMPPPPDLPVDQPPPDNSGASLINSQTLAMGLAVVG